MQLGTFNKTNISQFSILVDAINTHKKGIDFRYGIHTNWQRINLYAGLSDNNIRKAKSLGFSVNFHKWRFNYGVYFNEYSILGFPQFLDIRRYL